MKMKCGCIIRKILKGEKGDYPEETTGIVDEFCKEHQKEFDDLEKE